MQSGAYQILALGARYFFVFLAALLVLRGTLLLLQEHWKRKKILKQLPDAGMVGELRDADSGKAYPLPREGVLGSGWSSDIRIKGLRHREIAFSFVEGKGVLFTPCHHRNQPMLDERPLGRGGYALHGAVLHVGTRHLCVRLFAGLNVPRPAAYQERWQVACEEELYAPDEMLFAENESVFEPYPAYDPNENPYNAPQEPAVYQSMPKHDDFQETAPYFPVNSGYNAPNVPQQPISYPPASACFEENEELPSPFETPCPEENSDSDMPQPFEAPVRHRRSERRRNG